MTHIVVQAYLEDVRNLNNGSEIIINNVCTKEATFKSFTLEQAAAYAANRGKAYPKVLYETILNYHGGETNQFFDVGTGPGTVVFDLLPHFEKSFGTDAGTEMITQAKSDASRLGVEERTEFAVCPAEESDTVFQGEKMDLVTVAMAAHWFDMPKFYEAVGKILKPGATLAMWTCSSLHVHPSTPNHEKLEEILQHLETNMLAPYETPGNVLSRMAYDGLALPWDNEASSGLFQKDSFERKDWDRGGVPSTPPTPGEQFGPFVMNNRSGPVEYLAKTLGSASMVIRWREANAEKAHTEEDPINITVTRLKEALEGEENFVASPSLSLLLLRRA
ncbi:hypothetical protein PRZ48_009106 [Zasmidium cellare]|uniref:Methyltransferase domain-containing protein n=1 Tax=Zasmidium cellare TaxID=395010 RepID=A0ABR0EHC6_ZASCE|nr:hypothetical protein PRZ48_009106 [Zasmidium cellare]